MADLINGMFETFAGLFVLLNCRRVWIDREVKGVSVVAVCFFASWGAWNLWFYPSLGQWASFCGGFVVMFANLLWIGLMLWFLHPVKAPALNHRIKMDIGGRLYCLDCMEMLVVSPEGCSCDCQTRLQDCFDATGLSYDQLRKSYPKNLQKVTSL